MSSAASSLKSHFFKVPNDFAEHLYLLPDAELRLAIMACRVDGITISDNYWQRCSGRSARHKLNALRGLQAKNALTLEGRGNSTRYRFNYEAWSHYCRTAPPSGKDKPRTFGRGPTKTPVASAHPDCIANGCQMARRQEGASPLTLIEFRKPVSDSERTDLSGQANAIADDCGRRLEENLHQYNADSADVSGCNREPGKPATLVPATKFRKPVSNSGQTQGKPRKRKPATITPPTTIEESRAAWPLAVAVLVAVFKQRAWTFFPLLIAGLLPEFPDVTDAELAEAMRRGVRPSMKTPGLWQRTVPDELRQIRADASQAIVNGSPPGEPRNALMNALSAECGVAMRQGNEDYAAAVGECLNLLSHGYSDLFERKLQALTDFYARMKENGLVP
jgi:hypothetical protein